MGQIRKIQKHKEERDRSGKFKKTRRKGVDERKRRDFHVREGSHTGVFSIHREHPRATALMQPFLRRTHLYWNLPYNQVF